MGGSFHSILTLSLPPHPLIKSSQDPSILFSPSPSLHTLSSSHHRILPFYSHPLPPSTPSHQVITGSFHSILTLSLPPHPLIKSSQDPSILFSPSPSLHPLLSSQHRILPFHSLQGLTLPPPTSHQNIIPSSS